MDQPSVLEWVKVREVTGIFPSLNKATPAVDDLLLAGFDRAEIDVVAEGDALRQRTGGVSVPAVDLAEKPGVPRREFVAPEDTAAIFAICAGIMACLGAMCGALAVMGSGGSTMRVIFATVLGGVVGGGLGLLIARLLGRRWQWNPATPAGTDGCVLWVRVRSPDREEKALQILRAHGADAVRVHEMEIEKRLEDLPLSSLRPDPWLGNERLGEPT